MRLGAEQEWLLALVPLHRVFDRLAACRSLSVPSEWGPVKTSVKRY